MGSVVVLKNPQALRGYIAYTGTVQYSVHWYSTVQCTLLSQRCKHTLADSQKSCELMEREKKANTIIKLLTS